MLPIYFGYLDPGSGSLAIQIIFGSVLAGLLTLKTFWRKLHSLFKSKPKHD